MKAKTNRQTSKQIYVTPSIEIISMENEGVIAASGSTEGYVPTPMGTRSATYGSNSASSNDLEELISDILTVEK